MQNTESNIGSACDVEQPKSYRFQTKCSALVLLALAFPPASHGEFVYGYELNTQAHSRHPAPKMSGGEPENNRGLSPSQGAGRAAAAADQRGQPADASYQGSQTDTMRKPTCSDRAR
ncbi:hypothetical protein R77567_02149 [Ralstonia sp. LMG 32965]|uniref:Uncharacterized protein n=1 Tax=Ralstonia flatus TaxID=3058601 RepID=A0AAD2BX68_9RALS|nr:hypothetical protein R77567_02149 [Ralstonia sp. LMG 32965]CAJ0879262.1 hypothetical protein R77564_02466 [Ralstonia sp. LMG 32965]